MIAERGQNLLETAKERGRVQNGEDYGRFIRGSPTVLRAPTGRTLSSTHCAHDLNRPLKLEQRHGFEVRVGVSGRERVCLLPPPDSSTKTSGHPPLALKSGWNFSQQDNKFIVLNKRKIALLEVIDSNKIHLSEHVTERQ